MSNDELHTQLDLLRSEIETLTGDNTEQRDRLVGLIKAVEDQVSEEVDTTEEDGAFTLDSLKQFAEQLEVEHPKITKALNGVMNMLSNMGI